MQGRDAPIVESNVFNRDIPPKQEDSRPRFIYLEHYLVLFPAVGVHFYFVSIENKNVEI